MSVSVLVCCLLKNGNINNIIVDMIILRLTLNSGFQADYSGLNIIIRPPPPFRLIKHWFVTFLLPCALLYIHTVPYLSRH